MIVVVGNLSWDRLLRVPRLPQPNEDVVADKVVQLPGGAAANVAAVLALARLEVALCATVGHDNAGDALVADIASYGVRTHLINRVSAPTSEFLVVMDSEGNRTFLLDPSGASFQLSLTEELVQEKVDALILVGCPLAFAEELTRGLLYRPRLLVANVGFWIASGEMKDAVPQLLEDAGAVFANGEELVMLSATVRQKIVASVVSGGGKVVITNGVRPTVVTDLRGDKSFPVEPTAVLENTLGCGDAFMGGFLSGLITGLTIGDSVRRGQRCASVVASSVFEREPRMVTALG